MSQAPSPKLAVLLHADVVGSTALVQFDESLAHQRIQDAFRRFSAVIANHGGTAHEIRGDALVAEFSKSSDAVTAALAFQSANAEHNERQPGPVTPFMRIGIAMGEVVIADGTITGEGVVLSQRLEQLAEGGGTCIQGAVYDTVPKRLPLDYENLGEHRVKGFQEPVRVYAVRPRTGSGVPGSTLPTPSTLPDLPSIAVLPFANMSGDPEQEYFADGITEDIITELSRLSGLLVISRTSTFTYKGRGTRAQDVCRELGVRYMLEGSVRKAGERVRITAQLIDGVSGGHLWAERYDRGLADVFAVQDDVTEKIVRGLAVSLVDRPGARAVRTEPENAEAYDYVLRGREQYRLFSREGNSNASRLYAKAVALDPDYAAGYAGLAETSLHEWFMGAPGALDAAYELAVKASELDPSLPMVYEALGNIRLFRRQHAEAVAAARRWLAVEPGNADAYANLAAALHFSGESEQGLPLLDTAMRLNPFHPFYYILYRGQAYLALERFEPALAALKRSATQNPDALPAQLYLCACCGLLGEQALGRDALNEVHRLCPDFSLAWIETFLPYRRTADSERLVEGLRRAGFVDSR